MTPTPTPKRIPLYDETAAIACTIAPEEIPGRLATIERMRSSLRRLERTEHGLVLHFPPATGEDDLEDELRRFAVDEKRCCQFWGFDVVTSDDELALRWDGPPSAHELVDRLEAFFHGDEPADVLTSLL
jgi:hypothetical protein